jgi:DNA-directed RNA polymerase subunit RPC12/RpoP
MSLIGRPWNSSPLTFSARSYALDCVYCDAEFTFELGSLLNLGIEPATLRKVRIHCPHCGTRLDVSPKEVRLYLRDRSQA